MLLTVAVAIFSVALALLGRLRVRRRIARSRWHIARDWHSCVDQNLSLDRANTVNKTLDDKGRPGFCTVGW
jgi:hypothetical protein